MTTQLERDQINHSNLLDDDDLEQERQLQNELVGLNHEISHHTFQQELPQEPQKNLTQRKIWQRGSTHLAFIAGGVGLVSLVLLALYNSLVGRPNNITAQDTKPKDNGFFHKTDDSEIGKWKAAAAMGQQNSQLKELNNGLKSAESNTKNSQNVGADKSNPNPNINPDPNSNASINNAEKTRNVPTIRTATVRTPEPRSQVIYQPLPRTAPIENYRPVVAISAPPVNYRRTPSPLPIAQKLNTIEQPIRQLPQPINYRRIPIPTTPSTPISSNPISNSRNNVAFGTPQNEANDATKQLEIAANSGIYISNSGYNNSSPVSQDTPKTNPALITSKPTSKAKAIITTHIKGIIASPIAWSNTTGDEKFRVQLLEPLLASDGSMILPTNTLLLAQIQRSNQDFVNAQIVSALLNGNETPIPPNSLLLQGKSGSILKAQQSRRGGGIAKTLGLGFLNGATQATKILNSPTVVVTGGSSTVTNNDRNISAAFTEGFTSSIVTRGTANVQKSLSSTGVNNPVFFLKQNTPVQIFVNQAFSI